MQDLVIARKIYKRKVRDGFLVVDAQLHQLGEQRPYFSVTGELWDSEGWYENGQDGRLRECGQLHERILQAFPKLAPVITLHLSDDTGAPMYAVADGWYWYQRDHETCARHLRVALEDLPEGLTEDEFTKYVETQRPRWQDEADAVRKVLQS